MAKATVTASQTTVTDVPSDSPTFEFKLPDGDIIVCGRPRGVLKLKLREILDAAQLKDPEMVQIATAFLSIQRVGGKPILLHSFNTFAALMDRFGSDELLDEFMSDYQRLTNPGLASVIEKVLKEATDEHLSPEQIQDRITEKVFELEIEKRAKLRD
jgi:hypothetical protein